MKQLIIFLTLIFSITTFASPADADCDCAPPGSSDQSELKDVKKISPSLVYSEIIAKDLTSQICSELNSFSISPDKIEAILLRKSGYKTSDVDYKLKVASFWNKYSEAVICDSPTGKYPTQHFYKRVIQMRLQEVVLTDYFFEDEDKFPINVNAVEINPLTKEKTTVLDFLNKIIDDPGSVGKYNITQLEGLRTILVDYYGATEANLSTAE